VLDIDTLPDGDFVLAGHFSDEADLGFGPILSDHGTEDSYVVRYSDAGIPRWCSLWQGEGINLHSEIASHGDWIAFLALHDELIDLDPSVGQYFVEADGDSDIGASFLLNLQAETGQW
jgi:hypothetical protein